MAEYSIENVKSALSEFVNLANDLARSNDKNTFNNAFRAFIFHCTNDPVVKEVCRPLRENPNVNLNRWYSDIQKTGGSFIGSKTYVLPAVKEERISLIYQFILAMAEGKIDFGMFVVDVFGETKIQGMIQKFTDAFLRPFVRDMNAVLTARISELEKESSPQNVSEDSLSKFIIQNISVSGYGSVQIANASQATQSVATTVGGADSDVESLFDNLERQIKTISNSEERQKASDDFEIARQISKQKSVSAGRILPILKSLLEHPILVNTVSKIIEYAKEHW